MKTMVRSFLLSASFFTSLSCSSLPESISTSLTLSQSARISCQNIKNFSEAFILPAFSHNYKPLAREVILHSASVLFNFSYIKGVPLKSEQLIKGAQSLLRIMYYGTNQYVLDHNGNKQHVYTNENVYKKFFESIGVSGLQGEIASRGMGLLTSSITFPYWEEKINNYLTNFFKSLLDHYFTETNNRTPEPTSTSPVKDTSKPFTETAPPIETLIDTNFTKDEISILSSVTEGYLTHNTPSLIARMNIFLNSYFNDYIIVPFSHALHITLESLFQESFKVITHQLVYQSPYQIKLVKFIISTDMLTNKVTSYIRSNMHTIIPYSKEEVKRYYINPCTSPIVKNYFLEKSTEKNKAEMLLRYINYNFEHLSQEQRSHLNVLSNIQQKLSGILPADEESWKDWLRGQFIKKSNSELVDISEKAKNFLKVFLENPLQEQIARIGIGYIMLSEEQQKVFQHLLNTIKSVDEEELELFPCPDTESVDPYFTKEKFVTRHKRTFKDNLLTCQSIEDANTILKNMIENYIIFLKSRHPLLYEKNNDDLLSLTIKEKRHYMQSRKILIDTQADVNKQLNTELMRVFLQRVAHYCASSALNYYNQAHTQEDRPSSTEEGYDNTTTIENSSEYAGFKSIIDRIKLFNTDQLTALQNITKSTKETKKRNTLLFKSYDATNAKTQSNYLPVKIVMLRLLGITLPETDEEIYNMEIPIHNILELFDDKGLKEEHKLKVLEHIKGQQLPAETDDGKFYAEHYKMWMNEKTLELAKQKKIFFGQDDLADEVKKSIESQPLLLMNE